MKQVSLRFACIYLILVTLMLCAVIVLVPAAHGVAMQKSESVAELAAAKPAPEPGFVVGVSGEHLALFREGSAKPYRILRAELWLLSEEDRAAVEEGICVKTEAELDRLLEDLGAEE